MIFRVRAIIFFRCYIRPLNHIDNEMQFTYRRSLLTRCSRDSLVGAGSFP